MIVDQMHLSYNLARIFKHLLKSNRKTKHLYSLKGTSDKKTTSKSKEDGSTGGVVHSWVGQKHLNCYIFKCFFFYRSSLANFHVSA